MKKILYRLDNTIFDSSWELAYYIYLRDYGFDFQYHPDYEIPYKIEEDDDKFHIYHPDFIVNGKLIEIKGNHLFEGKDRYKVDFIENLGVDVITKEEIKPFLKYVSDKYGKGFLLQCRLD